MGVVTERESKRSAKRGLDEERLEHHKLGIREDRYYNTVDLVHI